MQTKPKDEEIEQLKMYTQSLETNLSEQLENKERLGNELYSFD